jgi:hypothetical protein
VDQEAGVLMFDDFSWWKLIWWAVGMFGIGGLIAICAIYPVVLAVVARFFRLVLSTRIGCAVVAAIVAALIADYARHSIEDDRHAAEIAAFEKKQGERDERIRVETREVVWKEIANATAENAITDKDVKDFTDALPPTPPTGNVYRVGTDACRLRQLAGQAQCGSESTQRVPKADTHPASVRDRIRKRLSGTDGRGAGNNQQGQ